MSLAQPLRLELSPCGVTAATVVAVHAAASACVLLVLPGLPGVTLAALVLALGIAAAWDRALLRGSRAPRVIEIAATAETLLVLANGETACARPVRGIGVTRWWVALRIGSPARRGFLVTAGMLGPEPFRLLRLWALWKRVPGVAPGQLQA